MVALNFMQESSTNVCHHLGEGQHTPRLNIRAQVTENKTESIDQSWSAGWKRAYNARGVGETWENPYLWPEQKSTVVFAKRSSEATFKDKPVEVPRSRHSLATRGKWSAILIRLGYLCLNYILLDLYNEYRVSATFGSFTAADVSPEKEILLRRAIQQFFSNDTPVSPITGREIAIRAFMAANKFIPDILTLSAFHDFLAIIFIASGVDQSWEWPPLFGSFSHAYTMRGFWSNFWHRLIYKSFNFHASTFTRTLGVPQGTSFSRILNNCLVFVMSTIMHGVVLQVHGSSRAWGRGTLIFWGVQPLSFVLEGVVQAQWRQFKKGSLWWMNQTVVSLFERVVGYAWVAAWFIWITPKSVFGLMG